MAFLNEKLEKVIIKFSVCVKIELRGDFSDKEIEKTFEKSI